MRVQTSITKVPGTFEFVVMLHIDGVHYEDADYFTDNYIDAEETAKNMIENHTSPKPYKMKPLDFVKTKAGNIGMITEVSTTQGVHSASIEFLGTFGGEKSAWWSADEFEVIDNLPDLLSRELKHPMGNNSLQPFKQGN